MDGSSEHASKNENPAAIYLECLITAGLGSPVVPLV